MKIQVELNYLLDEEPDRFKNIAEIRERKIYVWDDQKTILETDGQLRTLTKVSQITDEPQNCNMDYYLKSHSQVPPKIDDCWFENYKSIEEPTISLEWVPEQHLLRLAWSQLEQSLLERKLKSRVLQILQELHLEIPPFAKLLC